VTVAVPALAAVATRASHGKHCGYSKSIHVSAPLLPSEYAPVAASCIEAPMGSGGNFAGVTAMLCRT